MITFKQYLQESALGVDMDLVAADIEERCGDFVVAWSLYRWDAVMVRGVPKDNIRGIYAVNGTVMSTTEDPIPVRKNRLPSDTNPALHKIIDDWMHEHYGVRGRSECAFAYSYESDQVAHANHAMYGQPAVVIPVGDYDALWSDEIADLYTMFDSSISNKFNYDGEYGDAETPDDVDQTTRADIEAALSKIKYRRGVNPGKSDGELMIDADAYIPIFGKAGSPLESLKFKADFERLMDSIVEKHHD